MSNSSRSLSVRERCGNFTDSFFNNNEGRRLVVVFGTSCCSLICPCDEEDDAAKTDPST